MNPRNPSRRLPDIATPATQQLRTEVKLLRRRRSDLEDTVTAIRNGDDDTLCACVERARHGDSDAALIAIWALYPRMCATVLDRHPAFQWPSTIDDYLSLAYLTIRDCDVSDPSPHLADKIIARTRHRHERSVRAHQPMPVADNVLQMISPSTEPVERTVLARLDLANLAEAIANGLVAAEDWRTVVALRLEAGTPARPSGADRKTVSRAQRRLIEWRDRAA